MCSRSPPLLTPLRQALELFFIAKAEADGTRAASAAGENDEDAVEGILKSARPPQESPYLAAQAERAALKVRHIATEKHRRKKEGAARREPRREVRPPPSPPASQTFGGSGFRLDGSSDGNPSAKAGSAPGNASPGAGDVSLAPFVPLPSLFGSRLT